MMPLVHIMHVSPEAKKPSFNYLNAWLRELNFVHKHHLYKESQSSRAQTQIDCRKT